MLGSLHKIDHLPNAVLTPFTTWTSLTLCQHLARFDLQNEERNKIQTLRVTNEKVEASLVKTCSSFWTWSSVAMAVSSEAYRTFFSEAACLKDSKTAFAV
jgi:hypothetical protein